MNKGVIRALLGLPYEMKIDWRSNSFWPDSEVEIMDVDVVKYALCHMKPIDRLNPIRVGMAVLYSWTRIYANKVLDKKYNEDFVFKF